MSGFVGAPGAYGGKRLAEGARVPFERLAQGRVRASLVAALGQHPPVFVAGLGPEVDEVPLVDDHDAGLLRLEDRAGDVRVLVRHGLLRVEHQDADVGAGDRAGRAQHAVLLQVPLDANDA